MLENLPERTTSFGSFTFFWIRPVRKNTIDEDVLLVPPAAAAVLAVVAALLLLLLLLVEGSSKIKRFIRYAVAGIVSRCDTPTAASGPR